MLAYHLGCKEKIEFKLSQQASLDHPTDIEAFRESKKILLGHMEIYLVIDHWSERIGVTIGVKKLVFL